MAPATPTSSLLVPLRVQLPPVCIFRRRRITEILGLFRLAARIDGPDDRAIWRGLISIDRIGTSSEHVGLDNSEVHEGSA